MLGRMMDRPLLVSSIIEHVGRVWATRPVVSRNTDGSIHRSTWGEVGVRARTLARALTGNGIRPGDRVATLAWNNHRHLDLYYGVSGMGAVLHTVNPRLHPREIAYVLNHAEDRWVFVDVSFVALIRAVLPRLETVERVVLLEGSDDVPRVEGMDLDAYDDLLEGHGDDFDWPDLDERTAASLCYTSGTTGNPRGVLYSHRSTVLHGMGISLPAALPAGDQDSVLPVVPMFHANAWGLPYSCPMNGAGLVLPGPGLDGASLTALMNSEKVTLTAGVPTVWMGLLQHWRATGERVPSLERVAVGGAAPPASMVRAFEEEFGVEVVHGWGMTETSPVGTLNRLSPALRTLPMDDRVAIQTKQGRPLFGVELRLVDEEGEDLPWDGESQGELLVRGPWVCDGYFGEDTPARGPDGWFATGDVGTIDPHGYFQVTDRAKDLIKSGGEWISSIDLENTVMGHPDVAHAAVIGVANEKWGERPLLFVGPREGVPLDAQGVLEYMRGKVADWWLPDQIVFRDDLPLGGTGKVQKSELRSWWADQEEVVTKRPVPAPVEAPPEVRRDGSAELA